MPDIGLIDLVLTPPLGSLEAVPDGRNPWLAGQHSIIVTDPAGPVSDTYGVVFGAITQPLAWGYKLGYRDISEGLDARVYVPAFAQAVAVHTLLDGSPVFSQIEWLEQTITLMRWDVALPSMLGLYIQPGWEIDIYWLRLL